MKSLREALRERVLILDGGLGTSLLATEAGQRAAAPGRRFSLELLSVEAPEVVRAVHESFLAVGCDLIETNSFQGSTLALADYGIAERTRELNLAAARLAREACERVSTPEKPRYVLGAIGPGTRLPTLGQVDRATLEESVRVQAEALVEGGVDGLLIETCRDPLQIEAALTACLAARQAADRDLALCVSVTVEMTGTLLVGTRLDEVVARLADAPLDLLGLNCATGPREMSEWVEHLARRSPFALGVYPNAGLPQIVDGRPHYPLTPAELADWLVRFVEEDGASVVGGCCGTTPAHMEAVVRAIGRRRANGRFPAGRRAGPRESSRSDEGLLGNATTLASEVSRAAEPFVASDEPTPARARAREVDVPRPPFRGARVLESIPLRNVLPYVDEHRLFCYHWNLPRKGKSAKEHEAWLAREVRPRYLELVAELERDGILAPRAIFGFWRVRRRGDALEFLAKPGGSPIDAEARVDVESRRGEPSSSAVRAPRSTIDSAAGQPDGAGAEGTPLVLHPPRQRGRQGLSVLDFFPADGEDEAALLALTLGDALEPRVRELFAQGRERDSLELAGLADALVQATGEHVHRQLRGEWGIAHEDARDTSQLLAKAYRGCRFELGVPPLPESEVRAAALAWLGAERIGLRLGERALEPSPSALFMVCHHPDARYFPL